MIKTILTLIIAAGYFMLGGMLLLFTATFSIKGVALTVAIAILYTIFWIANGILFGVLKVVKEQ